MYVLLHLCYARNARGCYCTYGCTYARVCYCKCAQQCECKNAHALSERVPKAPGNILAKAADMLNAMRALGT